jgi:p-hydroxybenzoate 3-monooxygenase
MESLAGRDDAAGMKTQVAIIGAGPAGLLLAQLLHLRGIDSVVLEVKSREYIEHRVRAGVLESVTVDVLNEAGVGERLEQEGLRHEGVHLRFGGRDHRIDLHALTGSVVTVYGQQEVVKDLVGARLSTGRPIVFEVEGVSVHGLDTETPQVRFRERGGATQTIECDFIAGCDGFHGICRESFPPGVLQLFERVYPFAWLGILADVAPASEELIYANHQNGFALLSMRSPTVSRLYLQCSPDEPLDQWPDERIWDELETRFSTEEGFTLQRGPVTQKSVTPMRSFVAEPMQYGRLFLAGDAAHIVPPTGAKGMNSAVADVYVLAEGLKDYYGPARGPARFEKLNAYSATCLRRTWKVQRFSWWVTSLMHRSEADNEFDRRRQLAELDYLTSSHAAETTFAENYVGLPIG